MADIAPDGSFQIVFGGQAEGFGQEGRIEAFIHQQGAEGVGEGLGDFSRLAGPMGRSEAQHDPLTGLPNRRSAMDRIQQEWKAAMRGAYVLSCILVEVDRLQQINEALGFDAGDAALRDGTRQVA